MLHKIGALLFLYWPVVVSEKVQSLVEESDMEILILSLVAGLVVIGGLWMATRDTKPVEKISDRHNAAREDSSK
jgi:hypothetical protein